MNQFDSETGCVLSSNGEHFRVGVWNTFPIPSGIVPDACTSGRDITYGHRIDSTHWLVRAPLPPLPKVKCQEEIDALAFEDELKKWRNIGPERQSTCREFWNLGVAYARAQKEQK